MLEILKIKKFALINEAEIHFKDGLNIISGETGAGKSIILEAINLILGGRAKQDLVQKNEAEAVVEGFFDLSRAPHICNRLERFALPFENDELHIRRIVPLTGKNKIYINGEIVTLNVLQEVCEGLIDLCGQHEHQSLIKSQYQLELIDQYAGLVDKVKQFSEEFEQYKSLEAEKKELSSSSQDQRVDFLKFQIEELTSAELIPGEDEKLQEKKRLFQSSKQRFEHAQTAQKLLSIEEDEALSPSIPYLFQVCIAKLEALVEQDSSLKEVLDKCHSIRAELEDVEQVMNTYLENIDMDEEEWNIIQDRLAFFATLRRKYGQSVDEMAEKLKLLQSELYEIENKESFLLELDKKINQIMKLLEKKAEILTEKRKNASQVFSKTVTKELKDLNMQGSEFDVEVTVLSEPSSWTVSGAANEIQFNIRTNKGDKKLPLSKIASGGELSRVMLGIRRVMCNQGGIGVYLFDEIDSGMGGQTAFQVGKKLKSVSLGNQVICITHLPQVAAFSDHHIKVEKTMSKNKTQTFVKLLNQSEKVDELARMLGGPKLTKSSVANAKELIGESLASLDLQ